VVSDRRTEPEAGNLALESFVGGGLYVGGGIAPRILEKLKDGTFMKAFHRQGTAEPAAREYAGARDSRSRTALMGAAAYAEARAAELTGNFAAGCERGSFNCSFKFLAASF